MILNAGNIKRHGSSCQTAGKSFLKAAPRRLYYLCHALHAFGIPISLCWFLSPCLCTLCGGRSSVIFHSAAPPSQTLASLLCILEEPATCEKWHVSLKFDVFEVSLPWCPTNQTPGPFVGDVQNMPVAGTRFYVFPGLTVTSQHLWQVSVDSSGKHHLVKLVLTFVLM